MPTSSSTCVGIILSYWRISAYGGWGIMTYIVKITTLQIYAQIFWNFCSGFILSYPVQDGDNEWLCSSLFPIQLWNGSPITENWIIYSSISPLSWLYSNISPRQLVVFQWITGYIVVYPRTTRYIVVFSPDNKSYHGNWLYSSMSP